jgi:DnaJ-domain-containing protein 1
MDHFAAFGEQPRPWLEAESLKRKFLALSAELHPDKAPEGPAKEAADVRFANLNQSYNLLRHARTRVLHFLDLQGAPSPAQVRDVPETALEFFTPVAERTRAADELLKARNAATSPMLKVQFFEKSLEATTEIQDLQARLAERIRGIESEVQELDARWSASRDREVVPALAAAAASLGFLERWNAQLQQRLAALAF